MACQQKHCEAEVRDMLEVIASIKGTEPPKRTARLTLSEVMKAILT
jgi:hypothetical protein